MKRNSYVRPMAEVTPAEMQDMLCESELINDNWKDFEDDGQFRW